MPPPISSSLFEDQDPKYSLIEALAQPKAADKAHRRFSDLVKKIEAQREQLKLWQDYSGRYNQRIAGELAPLEAKLRRKRRDMAILIDTLLMNSVKGATLSRPHRSTLREMLVALLDDLLEGEEDETLKVLREKYRHPEDADEAQIGMDVAQSFLNEILDLDIDGDHGASSVEELMEYARQKMHERHEEERHREAEGRGKARNTKGSSGGAKAQAAQAQRDQAAKEVSQSLRDVFRKLVSALHPDREPDAKERQRKNELMQRVNRAYEANDLLTLLGLQLQIEQIDAEHLSSIPPQRLTHYIQILSEQLAELESEVDRCREPFRMMLPSGGKRRLTVNDVDRQFTLHLAEMRDTARDLDADLVAFRDPQQLRQRLRAAQEESNFDPFSDLDDLAGMIEMPRARRRGRKRRR